MIYYLFRSSAITFSSFKTSTCSARSHRNSKFQEKLLKFDGSNKTGTSAHCRRDPSVNVEHNFPFGGQFFEFPRVDPGLTGGLETPHPTTTLCLWRKLCMSTSLHTSQNNSHPFLLGLPISLTKSCISLQNLVMPCPANALCTPWCSLAACDSRQIDTALFVTQCENFCCVGTVSAKLEWHTEKGSKSHCYRTIFV